MNIVSRSINCKVKVKVLSVAQWCSKFGGKSFLGCLLVDFNIKTCVGKFSVYEKKVSYYIDGVSIKLK